MIFWNLLLLVVLLLVALFWLGIFIRVALSHGKRKLLEGAFGWSSQADGSVGISLLGANVYNLEQIENLLLVDYSRYEVILALDSQHHAEQFEALISRYHMIAVDYIFSGEFPPSGVRALYRSRKRSFRRLLIIDHEQSTPWRALDAAAGVACYDYLLPITDGSMLLPGTIERLVIELAEAPHSQNIYAVFGPLLRLFQRDWVTQRGGFGGRPWSNIPSGGATIIWEPLLCTKPQVRPKVRGSPFVWIALLCFIGVSAIYVGEWAVLCVVLTLAFVWTIIEALTEQIDGPTLRYEQLFAAWRGDDYKKFRNS